MLISFIGPDGAGKSTQVKRLCDTLRLQGKDVRVLDKWSVLDSARHKECRFIKSDLEELRVCISEMEGPGRALFLFWTMLTTLSNISDFNDDTIYLHDGYWVKHAASEIVYGIDAVWLEEVVKIFPVSHLTFYFDISPDSTYKRKTDFTPYECGRNTSLSKTAFLLHQKKVKLILDDWASRYSWVRIDASESCDQVEKELIRHMEKIIQGEFV